MVNKNDKKLTMDTHDLLAWRSSTTTSASATGDDDLAAEVDEPPEHRSIYTRNTSDFHKSTVRPGTERQASLLTMALNQTSPTKETRCGEHPANDLSRRRSTMSVTSAASTADLTSDGGITSPARTDTPSPPLPSTTYMNLAPYAFGPKPSPTSVPVIKQDPRDPAIIQLPTTTVVSKPDPAIEALVKKRCISFACGGKPKAQTVPVQEAPLRTTLSVVTDQSEPAVQTGTKKCSIKFACPGPKSLHKPDPLKDGDLTPQALRPSTPSRELRTHARSPTLTRRLRQSPPVKGHRDSVSTIRRGSQSPMAARSRKPNFIAADESSLLASDATRFHEFASEEAQEADWIRKDSSETKSKITISDVLKKENAIRQLGEEAEEEALEDEDAAEDEEDEDEDEDEDDDDNDIMNDDDEDFDDDEDDDTVEESDSGVSDGNETDNEAGFADSDDEEDVGGEFAFWTPGKPLNSQTQSADIPVFRTMARRTTSDSSVDSLNHMSPEAKGRKARASRKIRIRPGTPDLPDSTDFVCGTLDEDRPLENAYVSCMEARKREKHHVIPQDIDPSFPTSDPEEEEDNDDVGGERETEEDVWLHGKFEDSEEDARRPRRGHRRSPRLSPTTLHSPAPAKRMHSPPPPKRLHSPPPAKQRHRSPPPRKLFGHSPRRMPSSPTTAQAVTSPAASPTHVSSAIAFAPLGQRPGLTHTRSLPRTPNVFCKAMRAMRLDAANGNIADGSDGGDGHTRGAIDIVKGLEGRRQRRKEKFWQKHCNRARKGQQTERKPLPGKGAERMRELGLQMAGKTDSRLVKAEYVLSV